MEALTSTSPADFNDSTLVQRTLEGDRDAYGQIVARYQSLICSVAYSGTGDFSRSQDLAQETFLIAWKRLCDLRDPAHLRAWLCGIARNLVHNARRSAGREPAEIGESLDPLQEVTAADRSPSDQTIRREEEAILWRSLGRIPENYREPLILFYREHRSVEQVARALDLSVDATKQRLSRGRALLHEQVHAFIEGTLEKTKPGPEFTTAIMSALPAILPTAVAHAGSSAASGSSAAKAGGTASGGAAGFLSAIIGCFALLGAFVGWQMSATGQSENERLWAMRFWRSIVIVAGACIVPTLILLVIAGRAHPWVATALSYYLLCGYLALALPLGIWAWENHRRIRGPVNVARASAVLLVSAFLLTALGISSARSFGFPSGHWTDVWLTIVFALAAMAFGVWVWQRREGRRQSTPPARGASRSAMRMPVTLRWVGLATACMAVLLTLSIGGSGRPARVEPAVAREIIATHPTAKVRIYEYQQGSRSLAVFVNENGHEASYLARADDALLAALTRDGVSFDVLRQGRDFEPLGMAGRSLLILSVLTVAAGLVVLGRELLFRRRLKATL